MEDRCIAIYSRKSRFTGKGESIGNQIELCRAYIRNAYGQEYAEKAVVFEDEGFSGGNMKRPDFQKMMGQIRKGAYRAIVVYRLDRISRNISDFTGLIDELTKLGVSFVSIREQFDTGTPMGRAMMFIISVFSQLERETIAERIRDNMRQLSKTGRWLGGNPPIGFRSEEVSKITLEGKNRKSYRLALIPAEAEIPRLIFDLYTERDSLTAVEGELLRRRIKTKSGRDFTRFAVKAILQNPVYMTADEEAYDYFMTQEAEVCFPRSDFDGSHGILAYHRTRQESSSALLPVKEWIIAIGAHPGLVPAGQWIRVQASLERNKVKSYGKPQKNKALLTGLLFCACGERMYPKLTREGHYTYVCSRKAHSKGARCDRPNAGGGALDAAVLDVLRQLPENMGVFLARLEKSRVFLAEVPDLQETQLNKLRAEHLENEKRMNGLLDTLSMAENPGIRPMILQRMENISRENAEVALRIRALEEQTEKGKDTLLQQMGGFSHSIGEMAVEEKRQAVHSLVQKVLWDGTYAHVVLWGGRTPALPGEGSK